MLYKSWVLYGIIYLFQEIDSKIRVMVDEATKKAKADKEIGMDEIAADIYAHNLETPIRGNSIFQNFQHKNIGPAVNK